MDSLLLELEKEVIKTEINKIYDILYIKNLLEKSIKENCHLSQYNLAKYYFNEKKNGKQAYYWYKKSAEQGNAKAQYCVADFYARGICVDYNMHDAI